MTEQNEEHFEVISENKAREFEKKQTYKPLPDTLFIEESMIDGQGLFASKDIPDNTDLGISHIEIEKDKMAPLEMIRTPLGGFINHEKTIKEKNEEGKEVEISGPNCKRIKGRRDGCKIEYSLITRRDIKAGEELTLEYSMYIPIK
jgi:SET domain-containing protein